jgi:hypothetical protein
VFRRELGFAAAAKRSRGGLRSLAPPGNPR